MPLPKASEMSARQAQEQQAWKDNREKQLSQIRKTLYNQRAQMLATIRSKVEAAVRTSSVKSARTLVFSVMDEREGQDGWLDREKLRIQTEAWKAVAEDWVKSQTQLGYKMEVVAVFHPWGGRIDASVAINIRWS
jgi:hypothetical protein